MGDFTPTETLLLEVLVARARLGETIWTFDRNSASTNAISTLAVRGYVNPMHGIVEKTFRASLTDKGRAELMPLPYRAPMLEPLRTIIDGTEWDVTSWRENWRAASLLLNQL